MIDTHAHIDDERFDIDREDVIARSFSRGVTKIITVGAGLGSSEKAVFLAKKHENIFAAVGCHPHYFMKHSVWQDEHKQKLVKLSQEKKVVAIGEIGLDYHAHNDFSIEEKQKKIQKEGFVFQLELAKNIKKPVIIHCRGERAAAGASYREKSEAYDDLISIIKNFPEINFVFHSFGGRLDFVKENLGHNNIFFSFNGNITYAKPNAEILEVIKAIPLEKMMLETDCPYLAPVPYRGERNEPSYISYVGEKIAAIKKASIKEVQLITSQRATIFFDFNKYL